MCNKLVKYLHIDDPYKEFDLMDMLVASKDQIKPQKKKEEDKDYEERVLKHVTYYYIPLGQGERLFEYYKKILNHETICGDLGLLPELTVPCSLFKGDKRYKCVSK